MIPAGSTLTSGPAPHKPEAAYLADRAAFPGHSPAAAAASTSAFANASLCSDWQPAAPQTLMQDADGGLVLRVHARRSF